MDYVHYVYTMHALMREKFQRKSNILKRGWTQQTKPNQNDIKEKKKGRNQISQQTGGKQSKTEQFDRAK